MDDPILPNVSIAAWCEPAPTGDPPFFVKTRPVWPPLGEPPTPPGVEITLPFAVVLYGGEIDGKRRMRFSLLGPTIPFPIDNDWDVSFHPVRQHVSKGTINVAFVPRATGLHWGVLTCEGVVLTRVPILVRVAGSAGVAQH